MFAGSVSLHLKPNRVEKFRRIIENEVRHQGGQGMYIQFAG